MGKTLLCPGLDKESFTGIGQNLFTGVLGEKRVINGG